MRGDDPLIGELLDDMRLTLDELCRLTDVSPDWVRLRMHEGLLPPSSVRERWLEESRADPGFGPREIRRVREMHRLERDFDAVPELAALVADMIEEIESLRARLRRAGLG
ncbi:MAG: MerR family transcriptional regulator [Burkholderiaceae bacterium]|nr:MerR family transcriptional regulator [Burkholderiaceae bacterium]